MPRQAASSAAKTAPTLNPRWVTGLSLPLTVRFDSASAQQNPTTGCKSEIKSKSSSQTELKPLKKQKKTPKSTSRVVPPLFTAKQAARCAQHGAHRKACRILQKLPKRGVKTRLCCPLQCQRYGRRGRTSKRRRGKKNVQIKKKKKKKRML